MFSSLTIGASALIAQQRAVDVIAQNVANASNSAYTRQRVELAAATPTMGTPGQPGSGMLGTGVTVISIDRLRDLLSDVSWREQASASGSAAARADVLDQAQGILGPFSSGAPDALSKFWSAWDTVSVSPNDPAARQGVLDAGRQLASSLNNASIGLDQATEKAQLKVTGDVGQVNSLTAQVAQLNQAIQDATTGGSAPNDLLDARDKALDQLSQLTGGKVHVETNGMADFFVASTALVRGMVTQTLQATSTGGAPSVSAVGGSALPMGGEIGGYVHVAGQSLPQFRTQLDAIATSLRDVVNTAHAQGFDLNGNPGAAFFTGSSAATFAVSSTLTPNGVAASATGAANDGNNALALAQLRSAVALGTNTIADAMTGLAGSLGTAAADATASSSTTTSGLNAMTTQRSNADGVNVDSEMVDMLKYQRAYQAAAKVISISDSMLDTLINGLGIG